MGKRVNPIWILKRWRNGVRELMSVFLVLSRTTAIINSLKFIERVSCYQE